MREREREKNWLVSSTNRTLDCVCGASVRVCECCRATQEMDTGNGQETHTKVMPIKVYQEFCVFLCVCLSYLIRNVPRRLMYLQYIYHINRHTHTSAYVL